MKKILVLSDSHRNMMNMRKAVRIEKPDMVIHLGDFYQDAMKLLGEFPDIPIEAVNGNCDYDQLHTEKLITVEGKKIFMCHGHFHDVKNSYLPLEYAAREKGADAALCGHTHRIFYDHHNHLYMLNPGSIGAPRAPGGPTYGLLLIENGEIFIQTRFLDQM